MDRSKAESIADYIFYIAYAGLLISIVFGWRAVTSIAVPFIFLIAIIRDIVERNPIFPKGWLTLFLAACTGFFLLQILGLAYTSNYTVGIQQVLAKTTMVAMPFAMARGGFLNKHSVGKILDAFNISLCIAMLWCLFRATQRTMHGDAASSVFFYHSLVRPFKGHAIMFSILVMLGIMHALTALLKPNGVQRMAVLAQLLLFLSFLFLLSSKLVIIFSACWIAVFLVRLFQLRIRHRGFIFIPVALLLVSVALLLFTTNPVSRRFREIENGSMHLIEQDKFNEGVYFNGLQFRLLQWKLVKEILNENQAWLMGVSPGDAQDLLNKKYIEKGMYHGTPERGDTGFIGYNTHNQFLQSILQTGIPGLICFCLICTGLLILAFRRNEIQLWGMVLLLLCYTLNEAVLQTQNGLLLFTVIPLLLYYGRMETPGPVERKI